jgi:hypothetical protein
MSAHSPRGSNELRLLACFEADSEVLQGLGRYIDFGKVLSRHPEMRHASPAADLTRPKRSGETRARLPDGLHQELWIERTAAWGLVIMSPEGWESWCQHHVIVNPTGLAGRYKRHPGLIYGPNCAVERLGNPSRFPGIPFCLALSSISKRSGSRASGSRKQPLPAIASQDHYVTPGSSS